MASCQIVQIEQLTPDTMLVIDPRIADWVAARIPGMDGAADFGPCSSLGVAVRGNIVAGMVYNNYRPAYKSLELSMAATSPVWARRTTIKALLGYPFRQLGVERVTTLTKAGNARALRLNEGLGFVREGFVRKGFGDDDMVIMGLLRAAAARWID